MNVFPPVPVPAPRQLTTGMGRLDQIPRPAAKNTGAKTSPSNISVSVICFRLIMRGSPKASAYQAAAPANRRASSGVANFRVYRPSQLPLPPANLPLQPLGMSLQCSQKFLTALMHRHTCIWRECGVGHIGASGSCQRMRCFVCCWVFSQDGGIPIGADADLLSLGK